MTHGCHNHEPFKDGYYALNREYTEDGMFTIKTRLIKRVGTDACQYDQSSVDKACEGCTHFDKAAARHW